jgi:hypothetical protein
MHHLAVFLAPEKSNVLFAIVALINLPRLEIHLAATVITSWPLILSIVW